jgi:hypothetical protein
MQVAHHYFENGLAYFTRRINKCISMSMAILDSAEIDTDNDPIITKLVPMGK